MSHVTLLGAEEVSRAALSIQMSSGALEGALRRFIQDTDSLVGRLEAMAQRIALESGVQDPPPARSGESRGAGAPCLEEDAVRILTYAEIRKKLCEGSMPPGAYRAPASLSSINRLRERHAKILMTEDEYQAWREDYERRAQESDTALLSALMREEIRCEELEDSA